jgi:hypothetical protein
MASFITVSRARLLDLPPFESTNEDYAKFLEQAKGFMVIYVTIIQPFTKDRDQLLGLVFSSSPINSKRLQTELSSARVLTGKVSSGIFFRVTGPRFERFSHFFTEFDGKSGQPTMKKKMHWLS